MTDNEAATERTRAGQRKARDEMWQVNRGLTRERGCREEHQKERE